MVEVPTIFLNSFLREIIFVFVDNQFFANVLVRFACLISCDGCRSVAAASLLMDRCVV